MNPLFLRKNTADNNKPNFEKVHKLVKTGKDKENDKKTKQNMPNNWFYNENAAKQVWDNLESTELLFLPSANEQSPFKKIDESADRIRKTISRYEQQDQEMLMNLIDIAGDDTNVDSLDQDNFLTESRTRLISIIAEHIGNSDLQKRTLESLQNWYNDRKSDKENENDSELRQSDETFELEDIVKILADITKNKEDKVESAVSIHENIVQNLLQQVSEIQKQLSMRELLLANAANEGQGKGKRSFGRRGIAPINYDSELSIALRKIMELQNQITSLKQALIEYATPSKDGEERPSIAPLISLEKEIELDQKISVLTDEIKNLKNTNKILQSQLGKSKQNELILENKLQIADKSKKALDANVKSLTSKIEKMERSYEEKLEAAKAEFVASKDNNSKANIDAVKKYQEQIKELVELQRQQIDKITAENERRFRIKMKELSDAYETGNQSKIVSTTIDQYNVELKKLEEQNEQNLKEQQKFFSKQVMELAADYEKIIKNKDKESEILKKSMEDSNKSLENNSQFNIEENSLKAQLEIQEKSTEELTKVRVDFLKKINKLMNAMHHLAQERDALRNLIENSPVATLIDDLNFDFGEEEEEEDNDDDILLRSKCLILEKEAENKISSKYLKMLELQKKILNDRKLWELEQSKIYIAQQQDKLLSDFREQTIKRLQKLYQNIPNSKSTLEEALMAIIKQISKCGRASEIKEAMIPISEVDRRLEDLNTKIIQLETENSIWESSFSKIGKIWEKTEKEDFVQAVKDSVKEQAENLAIVSHDRNVLSRQLSHIKSVKSISDQLNIDEILKDQNLYVFDKSKASIDTVAVYSVGKFDLSSTHPKESKTPQEKKVSVSDIGTTVEKAITNCTSAGSIIFSYFDENNLKAKDKSFSQDKFSEKDFQFDLNRNKIEVEPYITQHDKIESSQDNNDDSSNQNEDQDLIKSNPIKINVNGMPQDLIACCHECSKKFKIDKDEIREKLIKVLYARCPDCLSQYNVQIEDYIPEDTTQKQQQPTSKDESQNKKDVKLSVEQNLKLQIVNSDKDIDNSNELEFVKNQLEVVKKQSLNIEKSFQERMEKLETAYNKIKHIFYEYALRLVSYAKQNTDNDSNRNFKIEIIYDVNRKIQEYNLANDKLKMCNIDILERLKLKTPNLNSLLQQTQSLLMELSDIRVKFVHKRSHPKLSKTIASLKTDINKVAIDFRSLIDEHNVLIDKLKKGMSNLSNNSVIEFAKSHNLLETKNEELMKEREENEKYKEEIRRLHEEIEKLHLSLNESFSKMKQLSLQSQVSDDNINLITHLENDGKVSLDSLMNQILQLRDSLHKYKKKNENLHLQLQYYENRDIINQARSNCILLRESPKTIFSYPEVSQKSDPLEIPLNTISNLTKVANNTPNTTERVRIRVTSAINERPQSATTGGARVYLPKSKHYVQKTPRGPQIVNVTRATPENLVTNGDIKELKDKRDGNSSIVMYVTNLIKDKPIPANKGGPGLLPYGSQPSECDIPQLLKTDPIRSKGDTNELVFKDLEKRIHFLEQQLRDMQQELHNESDRTHEANQSLFKAAIQNQKAVREIQKQISLKENASKGMMKAISMVASKDQEIAKLTKKIIKFNKLAESISNNIEKNKKEEEAKKKELISDDPEIDKIYAKIIESLNNNTLFSTMAQSEMKRVQRIQRLRKKALEREQTRIMGALDAMCFLTQPPMRPASSVKVTSSAKMAKKSKSKIKARRTVIPVLSQKPG